MAGTHTAKAMLTFTSAELRMLIDGLASLEQLVYSAAEGEQVAALRERLQRASDAVTPR